MSVELQRRRFTVDEYYAMADAGILGEDDRVELIEGEIIEMPLIGSPHASLVDRLTHLFAGRAGESYIVRVQNPVRLSDLSEPEPDVALLRSRADFYAERHPRPEDVLLIVEVAHTTLDYDRHTKLPLYAAAGIPEVWIVDVEGRAVEAHRDPAGQRFRTSFRAATAEVLHPVELPSLAVEVTRILG